MNKNELIAKYKRGKRTLFTYGVAVILVGATGAFFYGFYFIEAVLDAIDAAGREVESATAGINTKTAKADSAKDKNYELAVLVTGMLETFWLLVIMVGFSVIKRRSWSLNAAWVCGLISIPVLAIMMDFPPRPSPSMAIPPVLIIPPWFPFLRRNLRPGIGYGESEL